MTHVQALIDAVGLGAVYALIAVGIGLVFGVLRLVNFAYGQLIMVAAYMLVFTQGWGNVAAIVIALVTAVFAALVMERVAFRPLRTTSPATMLVATFAISYLLQNLALLRYTYRNRPVGDSVVLREAVELRLRDVRLARLDRVQDREGFPPVAGRSPRRHALGRLRRHRLRARRPRVHVAMHAGLVADIPDVDLERLETPPPDGRKVGIDEKRKSCVHRVSFEPYYQLRLD